MDPFLEPTPASRKEKKLLEQMRDVMRVKHYSLRTERTYCDWVERFIRFHKLRHPQEMGEMEVAEFLTDLARNGRVAASTQNQALKRTLVISNRCLKQEIGWLKKRGKRAKAVLARLPEPSMTCLSTQALCRAPRVRFMAGLLYGSGLRLMECVRLRVKDVDFGYARIMVRDGKGREGPDDDAAGKPGDAFAASSR